ncbi:cupin domain-containing protein [Pseudokordiimonas caeni]|uniref:cupin domain-containing protein n=1 Tax=Pseudokordiimonas caeni TaxID=2997908 RepID=UPI002811E0C4|nr:cupin domain-containing protein [Pseudokordiimonas caeni]
MTSMIRLQTHGEGESAPIAAEKLISGTPTGTVDNQYVNKAGNFFCGVWSSDAGIWRISYTEDELCTIIEGEAIVTDAVGNAERVKAGDTFVIPAGFEGTWETVGSVRKFYAIYEAA